MPKRKRTSKNVRRRRAKRLRRRALFRRRRRGTTNLLRGPINERALVKFTYGSYFSFTGQSDGSAAHRVYACNGLHDPNITGIGHQPKGWDQLKTLYNKYTVVGAKLNVMCLDGRATGSNIGRLVGYVGNNTNNVYSGQDHESVVEDEPRKRKMLHFYPQYGNNIKNMTLKFSAKKHFNLKSLINEEGYSAAVGANPTNLAYFHLLWDGPESTNPGNFSVLVKITYICMLHDPKRIDQS